MNVNILYIRFLINVVNLLLQSESTLLPVSEGFARIQVLSGQGWHVAWEVEPVLI